MKFSLEIPDETIEELDATVRKYEFDPPNKPYILKLVLLLFMDQEGLLVRDDWKIISNRIVVRLLE